MDGMDASIELWALSNQPWHVTNSSRLRTNLTDINWYYWALKQKIIEKIWTISRFVRVILAQGPC